MCAASAPRASSSVASGRLSAATSSSGPTGRPKTASRRRTCCVSGESPRTRASRASPSDAGNRRGGARRPQLLGQERVAVRARVDRRHRRARHRLAGDRRQLLGGLLERQALEPQVDDRIAADQLGDELPRRVIGCQLVAAERDCDGQPLVLERPRGGAQEVARRLVGPVDVLDDDRRGLLLAHAPEQLQHRGVRVRGRDGLRRRRRRGRRRAEQDIQQSAGGRLQAGHDGRAFAPGQRVEDPGQRRERELAAGQRQALAAQAEHPRVRGTALELAHQPRLADAGLARHDHSDA